MFAAQHEDTAERTYGETLPRRIRHNTQPELSDRHLISTALEATTGIWRLEVTHASCVSLQLNGRLLVSLPTSIASAILHEASCPFERASDIIAQVARRCGSLLPKGVRTEFEFDLARWIPLYFEL